MSGCPTLTHDRMFRSESNQNIRQCSLLKCSLLYTFKKNIGSDELCLPLVV